MGDEETEEAPTLKGVIGGTLLGFLTGSLTRRATNNIGTIVGLSLCGYELVVALGYKTKITKAMVSPVQIVIYTCLDFAGGMINNILNVQGELKSFTISFVGGFLVGMYNSFSEGLSPKKS